MPAPRRLFIAATNQHVGKTTATLGLIASLQQYGIQVGYCKPLGQKYVLHRGTKVDKDAPIFMNYLQQELIPEIHSPVIMSSGLTCNYLRSPESFDFEDQIRHASSYLEARFDTVVYEGTGHPGVGSVFDMSNGDTASLLQAGVILVVEGGIGKTIDQISLNKAFFEQKGAHICGVIINKVIPSKKEKVSQVVGQKLRELGIPLLGVIPYREQLTYPGMEMIEQAVDGLCFAHREELSRAVAGVVSLEDIKKRKDLKEKLLIVESCAFDGAIQQMTIDFPVNLPLSGILLTGEQYLSPTAVRFINERRIPTMFTEMSTFQAVHAIGKIKPKLSAQSMKMAEEAACLVSKHLNLTSLFAMKHYA
ncbi:MAG: AAA family ATPase [Bacteroidota bacterium]